jgi:hypothetical protein
MVRGLPPQLVRNFSRASVRSCLGLGFVTVMTSLGAPRAEATVTIAPAVNEQVANCGAGSDTYGVLFAPLDDAGGASFSGPLGSASCQVAISWAAGHIGIAYDGQGEYAGSTGKLGYQIEITNGDVLSIGFSANGSVSGLGYAGATIYDANNPAGLFFTVSCTASGCNKSPQATFVLGDGGYRILVALSGEVLQGTIGGVNFLNSLDATFTVPAGTELNDAFGVIGVPEPAAPLGTALSLLGLAGARAARRAHRS